MQKLKLRDLSDLLKVLQQANADGKKQIWT